MVGDSSSETLGSVRLPPIDHNQDLGEEQFTAGLSKDPAPDPADRYRQRYYRACRQLGVRPLSRLARQLGRPHIQLDRERLVDKDVKAVTLALVRHPPLESLSFASNMLQPASITYLDRLMTRGCSVTELDLSENQLGRAYGVPGGVQLLAELVRKHTCLRKLNLSGNRINDDDAEDVAKLMKNSRHLWDLNLSHNELRVKGGLHVGDAIRENDSMYVLDLSWNHLRGRGAECVAIGLMNNTNLTKLNLAWNGFGFEGCMATAVALRKNTSLVELDLSSNRVHMAGVLELWKGLMDNTTLRVLRIGSNPIQASCTTTLLCAVRDNPHLDLDLIDMTGVIVDKEFEVVLSEIQEERPDFRVEYDRSLPVHKPIDGTRSRNQQPVYNVDPVRILFHTKKNLRIIDMFNKMDVDRDAKLTKKEIHKALKQEDFEVSGTALDEMFDFIDKNNDGIIDLAELYDAERRMKRQVLGQAQAQLKRDKLAVERGDLEGLKSDLGGLGGRFSMTFQPDLARGQDSDQTNYAPLARNKTPLPPIAKH